MDAFLGTWKVEQEKTTGMEELLKLFGWNEARRQMYTTTSYTLLVEKNGDGFRSVLDYRQFNITIDMFKPGEEVEYVNPDFTDARLTVRMQNDQVQENHRTKEGITWETMRRIEGGNTMIAETICDSDTSVKCIQYLTRV